MQRALDALIVHAYETMREFFHKVFNTTVENLLPLEFFLQTELSEPSSFSSSLIRCDSECGIVAPERELRDRDELFSP